MTNTAALNKLAIIGVGLIGGSFALALRKAGLVKHIIGVGRSPQNMQCALERGVIDEIAADIASALQHADLVFLA
ncbi:MAG: prephenate dehydrogenase/arogenate dehydrogenase family protein, partial [Pseudomonadota bacterium]